MRNLMRLMLIMLSLSGLFSIKLYAQKTEVTGTVSSDEGAPLADVTIIVKGTSKATITNSDGAFTIDAAPGNVLEVSYIGYQTQTITIENNGQPVKIILQKAAKSQMDEVVVVGYGTQKKSDLTNAVATVDVEKTFQNRPLADPIRALEGVVPGLNIGYANGGLTTAASINIRGVGSINGTQRPLIMVDNVEVPDLSIINPNDIASISVLKDATSASIYGARAAFGVVLIKLKQGRRNLSPIVSYNSNYSWAKAQGMPEFADPVKELDGIILGSKRAGTTSPELFGMQLDILRDGIANWQKTHGSKSSDLNMKLGEDFDTINNRMYFYKVWDVDKIMFRTMPQINQNLSISGGSNNVTYFLSAGYNNQGGMLKPNPDNLKKYNITGGVNVDVTKWWNVGLRMYYRNFEYTSPYQYQDYFY